MGSGLSFCLFNPADDSADVRVVKTEMIADLFHAVDPAELAHALGEVAARGLDQQVVVIAHQAVGMHDPVEALAYLPEHREEPVPIIVAAVDVLLSITARGEVVERARKLDPQGSCHGSRLVQKLQHAR